MINNKVVISALAVTVVVVLGYIQFSNNDNDQQASDPSNKAVKSVAEKQLAEVALLDKQQRPPVEHGIAEENAEKINAYVHTSTVATAPPLSAPPLPAPPAPDSRYQDAHSSAQQHGHEKVLKTTDNRPPPPTGVSR
ncbi:hypothetical protein [Colwellia sp. TT2012]|uniref:hypothetical protein n=1 Tax=Colwellia sp. TT2012 TaxID=1720342 RepID=UPI0007101A45|nr:hypothetical protein [Colwellia sp. TT2012]